MLYQAKFGKHPFETSLKPKAMEQMIKRYPVIFPDEVDPTIEPVSSEFKALINDLLNKDPN